MADASDSKSDEGDLVWVQVPSPAGNASGGDRTSTPFCVRSRASLEPRVQGLRSAPVGAKQTSTGRLAPHLLQRRRFVLQH